MRIRLKPWVFLTLVAVAIVLVTYFVRRGPTLFVRSDGEMVGLLPHRDLTTVFINVDTLRRANLLKLLEASKPDQEHDYQTFVRETGFDYTRDIDALAARGDAQTMFFIIRGRFEWSKLEAYAKNHGGRCDPAFCKLPTSRPGRWASFLRVQPDVIALAVSVDPADVLVLTPRRIDHPDAIPSQPVWVSIAHSLLSNPKDLPVALRIFAIAMQSTDRVTLSIGQGTATDGQFELKLEASCHNAAIADTARMQLENNTKLLKLELAREHQQPNPADLTGLLTSGTFQVAGNSLIGRWPVQRELLNSLQ